jgi:hypothetical protein
MSYNIKYEIELNCPSQKNTKQPLNVIQYKIQNKGQLSSISYFILYDI